MNAFDLYELASAAALDTCRWGEVIQAACQATGAMGGAMFTPGVDPDGPHLGAITDGYGDIPGYKAHWAAHDPWLLAVAGTRFFETAGEVRHGSEFLPDAGVRRTAYYNDFGRFSGGGAGHKISLKVCDAHDPVAPVTHFVVGRPFSSPAFSDEDKACMARFWRPVQHAVHLHWKLTSRLALDQAPARALDQLPVPTLVLREDAFVEFANASALQLLREARLMQQSCGHLRRVGHLDAAGVRTLLAASMRSASRIATLAADGPRVRRLGLSASPIRQVPHYAVAWPRAAVLLVLMDGYSSEADEDGWHRCLARHFGLTRTEQLVLRRIAAGRTVEEIAAEKGVIPATVRTHLASLFDKTGRRRQSELVRLALGQ